MLDAMRADAEQRILVVSATATQPADAADVTYSDTYTLYAGDGYRLGDDSITPATSSALTALVTDLVSEATPEDVTRLADLGIAYVVLPAPYDTEQVAQLDGLAGLSRASTNSRQLAGWQVNLPTGLVRLEPADGTASDATVLPSQDGHVSTQVKAGSDRVLHVATTAHDGFSAELDGKRLDPVEVSTGAGFAVGPGAGSITVDPGGHRTWWLLTQALVILVLLVLASPSIQPTAASGDVEEEQ